MNYSAYLRGWTDDGDLPNLDVTELTPSNLEKLLTSIMPALQTLIFNIIVALIIYIIGKKLISFLLKLLDKFLKHTSIDVGVSNFLMSVARVLLYVFLVFMIVGQLGVNTASIVTVLGAVASNGRSEDEFVIVSNDAGFDAVVSFWQDQGREVSRLKMDTSAGRTKRHAKARKPVRKFQSQKPDLRPEARPQAQPETRTQQNPRAEQPKKQQPKAEPAKKQQPKAEQPKKQQPKAEQQKKQQPKAEQAKKQQQQPKAEKKAKQEQPKQQKTVVQELSKRDQAILKSVCRSIPSKDAGQLHDALNTLLGAEDGMRIYNFLKKNQEEQKQLEGVLLPESGARASNYVRLIYAVAGVSEETGLTITDIYKTSRKDGLQGINLAMVKKFGQDDANKYYPDLKRHYRILEKISKN